MPLSDSRIAQFFLILLVLLILSGWLNFSLSLLLGVAYAFIFSNPWQIRSQWAASHLLRLSVVLLGFGLNIQEIVTVAKDSFWLTLVSISFVLILGLILGKALKVNPQLSLLITGGTAICGGSAIAALAPTINAKPGHILVSISIVFILNGIGLLVYPWAGEWLQLSQQEFGLWAALGIHDTSSVVGAAASYGETALNIATTTKLTRALWIIPLVLFVAMAFKQEHEQQRAQFPLFILFFIGASLVTSFLPATDWLQVYGPITAKKGMAVSLFLLGTGFSRQNLKEIEIAPLWQGILLWLAISVFSLYLIRWF